MMGHRFLTLGVVLFLIATIMVVISDLRSAFREQAEQGALSNGSAHLDPIESPESPFLEDLPLEGAPRLALLTEDDLSLDPLSLAAAESEPVSERKGRPKELPEVGAIPPVPPLSEKERQLRIESIKKVYPNAEKEQIEFWLSETRGLPPNMIHDMLRLRKEIGPLSEQYGSAPAMNQPLLALTQTQRDPVLQTLLAQRRTHLENLLNADSVGYRRGSLLLVEDLDPRGNRTVHVAERKLSMSDGPRTVTHDFLDCYIEGPRFLVVSVDGRECLTKNGNLTIAADRTLGIVTASGTVPVSPAILIPQNSRQPFLNTDGVVMASDGESNEKTKLGTLRFATVHHPAYLKPIGKSVYAPTDHSGPIEPMKPGEIKPFLHTSMIELSNVNREQEEKQLEAIERLIERVKSGDDF